MKELKKCPRKGNWKKRGRWVGSEKPREGNLERGGGKRNEREGKGTSGGGGDKWETQ